MISRPFRARMFTVAVVGVAGWVGVTAAKRPVPGYTYRIRLNTSTNTDALAAAAGGGGAGAAPTRGAGAGGGSTFVLARCFVVGDIGRVEVTSASPGTGATGGAGAFLGGGDRATLFMGGGGLGGGGGAASLQDQYFLFTDSTKVVTVNTVAHTYAESDALRGVPGVNPFVGTSGRPIDRAQLDSAIAAFGGRRGGDSTVTRTRTTSVGVGAVAGFDIASLLAGRGGAAATPITDVEVQMDTVPVAPGDTIEGYVTRHYRITSQYTMTAGTGPVNIKSTVDIWAADLPFKLINPFDQTITTGPATDNLRVLQVKQQAARHKVEGTPIKIIAVVPLAASGGGAGAMFFRGGGAGQTSPMATAMASATTTQTLTVSAIKAGDVDDALFKVPADYTNSARRGRGQ